MSARYWRYNIQLSDEADADLIEYLEEQQNKADCIRRAVRAQMDREKADR